MLCVKETFLYLNENLKLTPQALSDKAIPMDELEDMHQRVCFLFFHCTNNVV
jgi:E3 ubiquitin-protein ligase listerin